MLTKTSDFCELQFNDRENNKSPYINDIGLQWIHNGSVYTKTVYNEHVLQSGIALYIERSMAKENIFQI